MKLLASLLMCAALTGCGEAIPHNIVTVRNYTDAHGRLTPHDDSLGFTYLGDGKGAKHEESGFNVLINPSMGVHPDDDLVVRVLIHELANVIILDTDDVPPYGPGWLSWDSDTLPPFTEMLPEEAAWFASHARPYRVRAKDNWLRQPVLEALNRISVATGVDVFVADY